VTSALDARPVVVAGAGPNGAGKSTFIAAHLRRSGLRWVNADELARDLGLDAYQAAAVAAQVRQVLLAQRESFVFETVFSDPAGEKLASLRRAVREGYAVILCFVGLDGPALGEERVAMRVLQGGHDVPTEKLRTRYPRTLRNLAAAVRDLPHVLVFDNSDLAHPFRKVAAFEAGRMVERHPPVPRWVPRGARERA